MKVGDIRNLLAYSILLQIVTIGSCENLERNDAVGNSITYVELKVFLIMSTRETSSKIDLPSYDDYNIKLEKPLVFIIHGYLASSEEDWTKKLAKAYLEQKDVVVFIVDWSSVAKTLGYTKVVSRIGDVAVELVNFINHLDRDREVDGSRIHIIGCSLGAHIAGIVGKMLPNLNRITGLDPAGPEFQTPSPMRLSNSDADYVDVIHTGGNIFGNNDTLGHVDFYVNGGDDQPGCDSRVPIKKDECSHGRAIDYFTESIENPQCLFVAASTESEAVQAYTKNFDERKNTALGLDTFNYSARGTMFIVTNEDSPFCRVSPFVTRVPPFASITAPPSVNREPSSAENLSILDYLLNIIVGLAKSIIGFN